MEYSPVAFLTLRSAPVTMIVFSAVSVTPVPLIVIFILPPLLIAHAFENLIPEIVFSAELAGIFCGHFGNIASSSPSTTIKKSSV